MVKYNAKLIAVGIASVGLMAIIIFGLTYAFFTASVEGNEEANQTVVTTSDLKLVFNDTEYLLLENALPGASASKTFTVKNTGTDSVEYSIKFIDLENGFGDELVYSITSTNGGGVKEESTFTYFEQTILGGIIIEPGVTQTYTITVKFKEIGDNQDYNQGAMFNAKLQIVARAKGVALDQLLAINTAQSDEIVDFKCPTVGDCYIYDEDLDEFFYYSSTPTSGFYYTSDIQYGEDNTRIYYFRGRVDNNWVSFGGFL